jgi:hypothetical protein
MDAARFALPFLAACIVVLVLIYGFLIYMERR